jgi:hypothetical protein
LNPGASAFPRSDSTELAEVLLQGASMISINDPLWKAVLPDVVAVAILGNT